MKKKTHTLKSFFNQQRKGFQFSKLFKFLGYFRKSKNYRNRIRKAIIRPKSPTASVRAKPKIAY